MKVFILALLALFGGCTQARTWSYDPIHDPRGEKDRPCPTNMNPYFVADRYACLKDGKTQQFFEYCMRSKGYTPAGWTHDPEGELVH
jgi:hypothetical protein